MSNNQVYLASGIISLVALVRLVFFAGFLHKLSANDLDRRVVTRWCMVISRMRLLMFRDNLLDLSMNVHNDSPFSCLILTNSMDVTWCSQLVANLVPNFDNKNLKLSTESNGSWVNQLNAPPFSRWAIPYTILIYLKCRDPFMFCTHQCVHLGMWNHLTGQYSTSSS